MDDNEQRQARLKQSDIQPIQVGEICQSSIVLPLEVKEQVIGVIAMQSDKPQAWDETQLGTFRTLAQLVGGAIQNTILYQEIKAAQKQAEIVAKVMTLGNTQAIYSSIVQGIKDTVGCDAVVLFVYNQDTRLLNHPPTMTGVRYPNKARRLDVVNSDSIVYHILEREEPYIAEKIDRDPLFRKRRFTIEEKIKSCVAIPLTAADHKVGVMFANFRSPHRFTPDELTLIELFANQAAVSIHNAHLFEEKSKRALALETLYEAGKAVAGTLSLDEILVRIAEQAWLLTRSYGKPARFSIIE